MKFCYECLMITSYDDFIIYYCKDCKIINESTEDKTDK